MPDDPATAQSLRQIRKAADPVRLRLLQREGWFRAKHLADELGLDRTVARDQAKILVDEGLLDQREVPSSPRQTFEWRVNPDGVRMRQMLEGWLWPSRSTNVSASAPETPRYVSLFAVASHSPLGGDLREDLVARLGRSSISQLVPAVIFEEKG
jgi:hypothetical protein